MEEIKVKKAGRKPSNKTAFDAISLIPSGSFLIFKKKNWKLKTLPGAHILRRNLNREFKVETLEDESGWKITAL